MVEWIKMGALSLLISTLLMAAIIGPVLLLVAALREQVAELQDRLDQERGVKQLRPGIGARLPT